MPKNSLRVERELNKLEPFFSLLGKAIGHRAVAKAIEENRLIRDGRADEGYLENESKGISLLYESGCVTAVFLHSEGKDGFSMYRGELPFGLSFDSTASEVHHELGESDRRSVPQIVTPSLANGGWDRYDFEDYFIHFTYRIKTNKIDIVTVQSKM